LGTHALAVNENHAFLFFLAGHASAAIIVSLFNGFIDPLCFTGPAVVLSAISAELGGSAAS